MAVRSLARIVVAGLAGDTGKSLVTIGLIGALRKRGLRVAAFKKGPDYIDPAWLGLAAGSVARNLDTWLMPEATFLRGLAAAEADIAVIEGNRGLFDGVDGWGSHSTARLATRIGAPVLLVVDASKATCTVAAQVLGCRTMDTSLHIGGVVLNRVATGRHERVIREAIANHTDVPVLGAVPRLLDVQLPGRHLGLLMPGECPEAEEVIASLAEVAASFLDIDKIVALARSAPPLEVTCEPSAAAPPPPAIRVGILRDRAFSFYYPENFEALVAAGAELVSISPLADVDIPALDALYAGGGFPEEHAGALAANAPFRGALARRIADGLPVWAECGGLMYLSRELRRDGTSYPMVGALPIDVEHCPQPQGHGYVRGIVDAPNPFFDVGTHISGHEHHHGRVHPGPGAPATILRLERGQGVGEGRDGLCSGSVVATWTHLHALATPEWAPALVRAAAVYHHKAPSIAPSPTT